MELDEKYINKKVRVLSNCCDWNTGNREGIFSFAPRETYILGIFNSQYVVYKPHMFGGYIVGFNGKYGSEGWCVNPDSLELIDPRPPAKPVKPYPHKCKKCHSPARKCVDGMLCSNMRCKVRRDMNKKLPKYKHIKPKYIYCPDCADYAYYADHLIDPFDDHKYRMTCGNKHDFIYSIKDGEIIYQKRYEKIYLYDSQKQPALRWVRQPNLQQTIC